MVTRCEAPLRAVLVGAGKRAESAVLPVLQSSDHVSLEAVVEINKKRLDEIADRFDVPERFPSIEEFSNSNVGCDVAFLATPPWLHRQPFITLLEMGLHVYCEKPLAYSMKDAEAMAAVAQEHKQIAMIGFDRRFSPVFTTLKELSERVAPASFIHVSKSKPGQPERQRMVIENAVHVIDMLAGLIPGEWTDVCGAGDAFDADRLSEKKISTVVQFSNGAFASFHQVRVGGGWVERIEAYGDGWTVIADLPNELALYCNDFVPETVRQGILEPTPNGKNRFRVKQKSAIAAASALAFLRAVREGIASPMEPDEALRTQRLCDAMLKASGLAPL